MRKTLVYVALVCSMMSLTMVRPGPNASLRDMYEAMTSSTPSHCLVSLHAQGTTVPPEGNPGHEEPAPGANCKHDATDPEHNCACHRECKQNTDPNTGQPIQGATVQEDAKCRVYCYKDHCHCPIENCE